jgi:Tol biopolymer transport system component
LLKKTSYPIHYQQIYLIIFSLLILAVIVFYWWFPQSTTPIITDSQPITSTKELEDFAQISPDGRYIAFVRHPIKHHLEGHIWLKDLTNDKEYKLTKSPIYARNISWHVDSKALLYVSVKDQGLDIVRMSISLDTMEADQAVILSRPKLNWISSLNWGADHDLYFIAKKGDKKSLFRFNLSTGEQNVLLTATEQFSPFELAISNNKKQLAVIGWHNSQQSQIKFLAVEQLENKTIDVVHQLILDSGHYGINWHPSDKSLLLSDGRHLYHLNLFGKMDKINYENFQFIRFAHFSPYGNTITIISEKLDIDIWLSPLDEMQKNKLVFDSNSMDRQPKFSPTGDRFAFITTSKGYPQLYIHHLSTGENQLVYENLEKVLFMSAPKWNQKSNKLTLAINGLPIIIELDNDKPLIKELDYAHGIPVQWYKNEQSLLIEVYEQGMVELFKLDLTSKHSTKVANKTNNSAYLNNDDEVLLISRQSINKLVSTGELKNIHNFEGEILSKYRTAKGIYLYIKNKKEFTLWLYSFANLSVNKIKQWPVNQNIDDIDNSGNFVLTHSVNMEKDIVFLTVK